MLQAVRDCPPVMAQRADILRLEIMRKYGGVYMDTDEEFVSSLDSILQVVGDDVEAILIKDPIEQGFAVTNSTLFSEPNGRFFTFAVEKLLRKLSTSGYGVKGNIYKTTGPIFVSECYRDYDKKRDMLTLSPESFMPYSWLEKNKITMSEKIRDESYGVHMYEASWW